MTKFVPPIICAALCTSLLFLWLSPGQLRSVPEFHLNTIDQQVISDQSLRGKPALITFWATSCSTCIDEIPALIDLDKKYSGQGFKIIGIAMNYDPITQLQALTTQLQLPYAIAHDSDNQTAMAFGIGKTQITPTTFLITADGKIAFKKIGAIDFKQLEIEIKRLINVVA